MKVILINDIKNLGRKGEVKEVADGYARNFLLPQKLVEIAIPEAIQKLENFQKEKEQIERAGEEKLKKMAAEIQGKKIIIKAKTEKNKLFGSIGKKEIAIELKNQGINLDEKSIILDEPIKTIGEKDITIILGKNIKTKITVAVEKD
jgi:large subunit ribosomal protein L9